MRFLQQWKHQDHVILFSDHFQIVKALVFRPEGNWNVDNPSWNRGGEFCNYKFYVVWWNSCWHVFVAASKNVLAELFLIRW